MTSKSELNQIRKLYEYTPDTGTLYRNGNEISCINSNGYKVFNLKGKLHYVHRVVWEIENGLITKTMTIDHINGDRLDNRAVNLRLVTQKENCKNQSLRSTNKSGHVGVFRFEESDKWCAQITVDGKAKHLGLFKTIEEAIKVRNLASKQYGYHSNHGNWRVKEVI